MALFSTKILHILRIFLKNDFFWHIKALNTSLRLAITRSKSKKFEYLKLLQFKTTIKFRRLFLSSIYLALNCRYFSKTILSIKARFQCNPITNLNFTQPQIRNSNFLKKNQSLKRNPIKKKMHFELTILFHF